MSFVSPTFVGFIFVVALASQAVDRTWWRSAVLLLASVVFMASQVSEPLQLLPLSGFVLLGYALVELLRRTRSTTLLYLGVGLVLVLFIVLKRFSFLPEGFGLPFLYLIAGLSYILFRIIHLMVDAQQGELEHRLPLLRYLNFSFNFLTFTAGPIQRYQDFEATQNQARALDRQRTFEAFARIVKGFVKVAAVSAVFEYLFSNLSGRLLDPTLAQSWLLVSLLLMGSAGGIL